MKFASVITILSSFVGLVSSQSPRVVSQCTTPNTVAITFDDGPTIYTQQISDIFAQNGARVTFFVNGFNYGCIYDRSDTILSAFNSGHQIASHTWSHADLTTLSEAGVVDEAEKLQTALRKILGVSPTYVRPPYGSYNVNTLNAFGMVGFTTVALWDLDSGDSVGVGNVGQQDGYNAASTDVSHIVLQHDTSESTASMSQFIINWARSRNLQMVTVAECLGDTVPYMGQTVPEVRNPTWIC